MKAKKLHSFLTAIFLVAGIGASAAVLRVNNNPAYNQFSGAQTVYSTLAAAIAAAANDDIIYIEASATPYDGNTGVTLNKRLTIYGTGYFLNENTGLQNNPLSSKVESLIFATGSSGSSIYGIEFIDSFSIQFAATSAVSNVTISRCYLRGAMTFHVNAGNISNLVISKNYMQSIGNTGSGGTSLALSNLFLNNNYFASALTLKANSTGKVMHNVFQTSVNIDGIDFFNNICLAATVGNLQDNNNATNIHHNLFRMPQPAWLTNNASNTFFVSAPALSYFFANTNDTTDKQYQLRTQPLCPECYTGYPTGSQMQMGMYGGNDSYFPSGIPAIPTIYSLQAPGTAPQGGTLTPVTIGTKSNN